MDWDCVWPLLSFGASAYHDTKAFICQVRWHSGHAISRVRQNSIISHVSVASLFSAISLHGIAVFCGVRYRGLEYPVLLHVDFGDLRIQKYYWEEKAALRNSSHFLEERLYKDSYIEE